jgi:hypothetical protein
MRRAEDSMRMEQAVQAHIYHRELTEESRKSCEHVTQR